MKHCKSCSIKERCIHYDGTDKQCTFEVQMEEGLKRLREIWKKEIKGDKNKA